MTQGRGGFALRVALSVLPLLFAGVAPASAHTSDLPSVARVELSPLGATALTAVSDPAPFHAASPTRGSWWLVMALAGLTLGWRRPRRALALGLCVIVVFFAFETGLHSVHHLGAQKRVSQCSVALALAHVQGALSANVDTDPMLARERQSAPYADDHGLAARPLRPDAGRAPPVVA